MHRVFYSFLAAMFLSACGAPEEDVARVLVETEQGALTLELYPGKAPLTVANFLHYVDEGAFDGAYFYRTTRADNDPEITVIQGGLWAPWEADMD